MRDEVTLARLLEEMFTPSELYTFLRHHVGVSLVNALPGHEGAGRARYAALSAEMILHRRLLAPAFVEAWAAARPERSKEIRGLLSPSVGATAATAPQTRVQKTRWYWYISPQKLANVASLRAWQFVHDGAYSAGTPWGQLTDRQVHAAAVARMSEIEADIYDSFNVISAPDVRADQPPVFFTFGGKAGHLLLRESYQGEDGDCLFMMVGVQQTTGVLLLGSGANVVGSNQPRPRHCDPSADPVGAVLAMIDGYPYGNGVSHYSPRVGFAAKFFDYGQLEQQPTLAECCQYSFAAAYEESQERSFHVSVRSLAVVAAIVPVDSQRLSELLEAIKAGHYPIRVPDFPAKVERIVVGSPLYVERTSLHLADASQQVQEV